jgi:hypothetical protein
MAGWEQSRVITLLMATEIERREPHIADGQLLGS